MNRNPHEPVLLSEFLNFFAEKKIRYFIDCTVGGGGHAHAILTHHPEIEKFIGLDQDPTSLSLAASRLQEFGNKVELVRSNFRHISSVVNLRNVDGIFLDLGVSSMQLDQAEKGFSFSKDGPLDMRMDPLLELDASKIVNTFSEKELEMIFREYGEEPRSRWVAKAIVEARRKKKIKTTLELCDALKTTLTWGGRRNKKIHPMTLVFQALRIRVNEELQVIGEALTQSLDLLAPCGRMGVIAFHSLEDRIVKEHFRAFAKAEFVQILTKKPLQATDEEIRSNPRSRSAKMRFIEKL